MQKTAVFLALWGGLLAAQQEHSVPAVSDRAVAKKGFTGRIEVVEGQPKLEALSIVAIGPAAKDGLAPIVIESFDRDGAFRSDVPLPEKFAVNTLPDPCIAVKTLVLNEISETRTPVAQDRLGVTTTVRSGAVEGAGLKAQWSATEQFKGAQWSVKFELPLPAFTKMFRMPSISLSGRVGGINLSCEEPPRGEE